MSKLSGFKRLIKEDVEEQYRPLIDKIGFSINNFAEEVINLVNNKNIGIENLNEEIKQIDVTLNSDGTPKATTTFKSSLKSKLQGIVVIKVENLTIASQFPTAAPFISYDESNKLITITHITGLQADTRFLITVRTLG